jgi:NADH-quinone oxidoreductase subunit L
MFVGWEGVGLASYLLIGFFFVKDSAANAGKKAFITNRIGDFGFLIALFLLIQHFGSLQYHDVFARISQLPAETHAGLLTSIGLLMLVGAAGKSAQIPLYVWLPDAMEGPTPVSALIHAATMVTAGVYMVCRSNAVFTRAPIALETVAIVGALTALFASTIGITQTDIKRVLAYSTVSQLGYMFMAAGVAAYSAAIFHLMTHAFFKALLFLAAGSVIHGVGGEQDMRKMGGLRKYMPVTFWTMFIATYAITGLPFFAGFYSKDEILWQDFSSGHRIIWLIGAVTAFITSFYMFRLIFMTFAGEYRGAHGEAHVGHTPHTDAAYGQVADKEHATRIHAVPMDAHGHGGEPHESPWLMLAPLTLLAVLSIGGGWIGIGGRFDHFLAPVFQSSVLESAPKIANENLPDPQKRVLGSSAQTDGPRHTPSASEAENTSEQNKRMEETLMIVAVLIAVSGLVLAWFLYVRRRDLPAKIATSLGGLYTTVLKKYYVDEFYGATVIRPIIRFSTTVLWKGVDATLIDGTFNGSARATRDASEVLRRQQSGSIRSYAAWVAAGAGFVVLYMIWTGIR